MDSVRSSDASFGRDVDFNDASFGADAVHQSRARPRLLPVSPAKLDTLTMTTIKAARLDKAAVLGRMRTKTKPTGTARYGGRESRDANRV